MAEYFIPAPIGGLNYRDPIPSMPEVDALTLDNVVCEGGYVRTVGGASEFCDLGGAGVTTLVPFTTIAANRWLVAVSNNGASDWLYSINSSGTATDISGTVTNTIDYWSATQFNGRLYMGNGTDQPIEWTGTGNATATAWTGLANINDLFCPCGYKSRIYWCEEFSSSVWYSVVATTLGGLPSYNLTSFNLGKEMTLGAGIAGVGTVNQTTDGIADLIFFLTFQGEILVYSGDNPGASNWQIVGKYRVQLRESTFNSIFYVENEAHVQTIGGPISINWLITGKSSVNRSTIDPSKIEVFYRALPRSFSNALFVASNVYFPDKNYAVLSYANSSTVSDTHQLVVNLLTKAWSRWTQFPAICWAYQNAGIFFGSASGKVYKADIELTLPPGGNQTFEIKNAYNYLGSPNINKTLATIQPVLSAEKASGAQSSDTFRRTPHFDFGFPGGTSDSNFFITNTDPYFNREIYGLSGLGKACTIDLQSKSGGYSTAYDLRYYGSWVTFNPGGPI